MLGSEWRQPVAFAHRWLGVLVGAVFVVTGLTGTALAYAPEILRALYPTLDRPLETDWPAARAEVLASIHAKHPDAVGLIRFPTEALPAYEVYLTDGAQSYYAPGTGEHLATRAPGGDPLMFAHDLHIHLLAGGAGERLLGWLGLAMITMLVIGLWLWWPRRGAWRATFRKPRSPQRRYRWLWWHKIVGAVSFAVLMFVTLTGPAIIFYAQTQAVLTTLFGGDATPLRAPAPTAVGATDWNAVLASLDRALPSGRTVFYYPGDSLTFRKRMPDELHPNGRSFIRISADGTLLSTVDASRSAAGQRMTNAIYPLHAGRTGSESWRAIVAATGVLPLFFFVTGVYTWLARRRHTNTVPSRIVSSAKPVSSSKPSRWFARTR